MDEVDKFELESRLDIIFLVEPKIYPIMVLKFVGALDAELDANVRDENHPYTQDNTSQKATESFIVRAL